MSGTVAEASRQLVELAPGVLVSAKYELLEAIGEGGMARVWRARRSVDGREVALKFLASNSGADVSWRRRFEREVSLLSRLGHLSPHVVRIEDHDFDSDCGPYLAMELLTGLSLATRLAEAARLPTDDVVRIVGELCDALAVAHRAGVIHRDIKPANIFLRRRPGEPEQVKLLDFGVAKVRADSELTAPTREGALLGAPAYMSPEQFLGDTGLDARSDLWSVAVVAYHMLVGHAPFSRGPAAELAARILGQQPAPPSSLLPSVAPEVDEWFTRALAKRPRERFASASELASSLATAVYGGRLAPRSAPPRRAKGVNLIELVKLLRIEHRAGNLGELSPEDAELLDERILVSSWYPIEQFWRVLELAHDRVLGRSETKTIELGRLGARRVMSGVHSAFVQHDDLARGIKSFERGWDNYFDFGSVDCRLDAEGVRIVILGYPDMPRCHALTTLGWYQVALEMLGFEASRATIASGPSPTGVTFEYRR